MDFSLSEEQRAWQLKARQFAETEISKVSLQRDGIAGARETFDWEIIKKGSKLGFRTLALHKEWGGHGADIVTQVLVMAELARADSAISKTFSQNWKWSHLIAAACTEEQKKRFLPKFVADDTYLLGSGNTEPNAGSDNRMPPEDAPKAGMRLHAERKGDEWVLNGEKCFIANGSVAKLFFIRARTNPEVSVRDGVTDFLVTTDTPGFRIGKVFNKRGWRFYQNAELIFENARIPHSNLVGEVNGGAKARANDVSHFNEFELAANALGVCMAACDGAMKYATTHKQGGRFVSDQQLVQRNIAEMNLLTEALRSYVLRTGWERDQAMAGNAELRNSPNAAFVMIFAQEIIQRVTALGADIRGAGRGGVNASADKLRRDAMIWTHLAGDTVQRVKVAKQIIGQHAKR
jgi:alkylation response protein AidB-like acyl-CoA dehydrogenase